MSCNFNYDLYAKILKGLYKFQNSFSKAFALKEPEASEFACPGSSNADMACLQSCEYEQLNLAQPVMLLRCCAFVLNCFSAQCEG